MKAKCKEGMWKKLHVALHRNFFYIRPRGGTQKSFILGGSAPRSNPLPFYIPFFRKGTPFVYLLLEKGTPFIYLLKKTYE